MKVRLNKYLSEAGVASRREADRWILEGRISVNRKIVDELGVKVDEDQDVVQVDGKTVRKESRFLYVLLNKPAGYLVTLKDPFHRPTVRDLIPTSLGRVFPVGRLDFESEGALLLTNDGELAYRLTHPRFEVRKVYVAKVRGEPDEKALRRLGRGVLLEGKRTAPAKAALLTAHPKSSRLRIELSEGRKREVREMCRAVGHPVLELRRIEFAGLGLKPLKRGQWRHLELREVRRLKRLVDLA
ncbi:MAG TPA: pseudouridine synthase [Candidatus Desulfaltia sp.]|nr:pseudouridine synthase [Candidatus Desulfaltia sp.]